MTDLVDHTDHTATDQKKRHTLKVIGAATATSFFATQAAFAALDNTASGLITGAKTDESAVLDCTLITKPGDSVSHLLLSNPTDTDVVIERFNSALIRFDNGSVSEPMSRIEETYSNPIVIPSFDDVMVEFKLKPGLQTNIAPAKVVNLESATRYLPEQTRVSTFSAVVKGGVAEISSFGRPANIPAMPA